MQVQLRIEYLDGGKVKATNMAGITQALKGYMKEINLKQIKNCGVYTYPLKNNEPLILIKNNEINKENMKKFMESD